MSAPLRGFAAATAQKVETPKIKVWNPHPFQKRSVKYLVERPAAALLLDPGLGKTSISYAALKVLKRLGMLQGALVVAPRRVAVSVWPQEQQEWVDFKDLKVVVLHGEHKTQRVGGRADVYVINYEGLPWLVKNGHLDALLRKKWVDVLIIDELSKVKHIDSSRHKTLAAFAHRFARRWGLTGSPASNGLLDVFGQAFMLDFGKALGLFYTHFRWNFFYPSNADSDYPVWLPKPGAKELIYERLKPLALRIEARKHVKMPELMVVPVKMELEPKVRKVYDAMELEYFSVLDNMDLVTASTAAAAGIKCRQIATGAIYEDRVDPLTGMPRTGARKWNFLHDNKIEALADLVDELQSQPLLIVYWFGHDLARIQKAYPNIPVIGGGISDKKALAHEAAWNRNDYPFMAVHPLSVGHGLNLQKGGAHHFYFFTSDYDYEVYDQMLRRLMRQGNPSEFVFAHIPVTKDTVEEAIKNSLGGKRRTQDEFLFALQDYREQRRKTLLPVQSKV